MKENSWMIVLDSTGLAVAEVFSHEPPAKFDGSHWTNTRTAQCVLCARKMSDVSFIDPCPATFTAMRPSEYLPTLNKRNKANDN